MIESFRCKETEKLFHRRHCRRISGDLQRAALRKLLLVDAAEKLEDLRVPPGNHLEKLSGDRKGEHSIRISGQRRVSFRWSGGNAYEVEITDYHQEGTMRTHKIAPIHPGEILLEEFLKPLGISQYRLAKDISVPARRINEIIHGTRSVSADTALRLSRYFNLSERFWLNLQARYDLETQKDKLASRLKAEVKVFELQRA
jgi:addiction module HigA family antidote